MREAYHKIEKVVHHQLSDLGGSIREYSAQFGLDASAVAAILYTERVQYHLPTMAAAVHRAGHTLVDLFSRLSEKIVTGENWRGVNAWLNCSRSFCRIKWETAKRAMQLQPKPWQVSELELCRHTHDDRLAVKVACLILATHVRQWAPFVDISRDTAILATLYNISDFQNKKPHGAPRVGGSVGCTIAGGELVSDVCFGERARIVEGCIKQGYEGWLSPQ